MYKFLIVGCFTIFCAAALSAQTSPVRKGAEPVKSTTAKTRPATTGVEKARPAATPRENGANSTSRATQRTSLAPSQSGTTEKGMTRLSATAPAERNTSNDTRSNTSKTKTTTARTIPNAMPAAPAIDEAAPQIRWLTIEEVVERSKTEKRKVFVDVYTEWCGWCKRMDQTSFTNRDVVKYINEHYYPVKFDAEQQKDIAFKDKTYHFKRNGARGYHELAAEWLGNRLSYPTVVFLDENLNVIQPLAGYLEPVKLETILHYFGTDSHKTTPWETYEKRFGQR